MKIQEILADFFRKYGSEYELNGKLCHGVFSPVGSKEPEFLRKQVSELGKSVKGGYLLTTLPEEALCRDARLFWRGETYRVAAAEERRLGDQPLYRYAVLQKCGAEE